jgi:YHS domain-containing protein
MIMPKDKAHCDIDPVCQMDLSGKEGKVGYDFEDETYYFCSELCKDHFVKEPKKYTKKTK